MSNEKIDLDKVTVGPVEREKTEEVAGESNPVEGQESIQGQIEQQEAKLQVNVTRLQENTARLPDNVEIKDDGIKSKIAEYKEMISRSHDSVMTGLGLLMTAYGLAGDAAIGGILKMGMAGSDSIFAMASLESGAAHFTAVAGVGLLATAYDQISKKIGTYMQGRKYEGNLKEQTA